MAGVVRVSGARLLRATAVIAAVVAVLLGSGPAELGASRAGATLLSPQEEAIVAPVADLAPELLSKYIRIDTSNPPGNELAGVRYLAELLAAEGIDSRIFESAPGRGNLYARLQGTGKKKPIILLSHVDVVPADRERWERPPFEGIITEDAVHGRGALDAKGIGITQLLAVVAIKRLGVALDRDVILLATAAEETGGALGAGWMTKEKFDLFSDAEFVLNEGGFIRRAEGRPLVYNLNAAEKGPCWFSVIASGEPGHASRPAAETAVTRLVRALDRLLTWERPYEVGPVVAGYYAAYAVLDERHARQLRQLARSLEDPEFYEWFMSDPGAAALVTDTLTPTVLVGSNKTNVVPSEAVAHVDSRLLPGRDCADFLGQVRQRIGDPDVRVEPAAVAFPSSQSPLHNEFTEAVERLAAADAEPSVVLPGLQAGFTDSHYFRARGIDAYGFTPLAVTAAQRKAVHGPNERVGIAELKQAVRRMTRFLQEISR